MTDSDPETRRLAATIGAHALHSQHDSHEITAKARAAFYVKFLDEVDPDRELPEGERLRRADHALRAHMIRLSLLAKKRRASNPA